MERPQRALLAAEARRLQPLAGARVYQTDAIAAGMDHEHTVLSAVEAPTASRGGRALQSGYCAADPR